MTSKPDDESKTDLEKNPNTSDPENNRNRTRKSAHLRADMESDRFEHSLEKGQGESAAGACESGVFIG